VAGVSAAAGVSATWRILHDMEKKEKEKEKAVGFQIQIDISLESSHFKPRIDSTYEVHRHYRGCLRHQVLVAILVCPMYGMTGIVQVDAIVWPAFGTFEGRYPFRPALES
jgi:hypothetical protein